MASTGSTCSVSSITDSATTSSFRGVLNTRAVLQDLEGSEEYDPWRSPQIHHRHVEISLTIQTRGMMGHLTIQTYFGAFNHSNKGGIWYTPTRFFGVADCIPPCWSGLWYFLGTPNDGGSIFKQHVWSMLIEPLLYNFFDDSWTLKFTLLCIKIKMIRLKSNLYGGFLKDGYPQIIHLRKIFYEISHKPCSYWCTPIQWKQDSPVPLLYFSSSTIPWREECEETPVSCSISV